MKYYERKNQFTSWTRVDLAELAHAPFHNPSKDPKASMLKRFIEDQVKNNFKDMITASSFTKKGKGVRDPHTGKPMVNVTWPPTDKVKSIPISKPNLDGS
ncbi:hypothetical protein L2E82_04541 [Cichorium intybus]|uniref:Uncharacterized protein n=1 Tax=Cichorium intybus TaxID=13427 RepID=A0ACB9H687_CICIN|nr:hypothetical protein L2E82_04541 [Cichorium intybus]